MHRRVKAVLAAAAAASIPTGAVGPAHADPVVADCLSVIVEDPRETQTPPGTAVTTSYVVVDDYQNASHRWYVTCWLQTSSTYVAGGSNGEIAGTRGTCASTLPVSACVHTSAFEVDFGAPIYQCTHVAHPVFADTVTCRQVQVVVR